MSGYQIVIVLVCAGLGFGIVNNLINAARKPDQIEDHIPDDPGQP
jgi:hypothetical protein